LRVLVLSRAATKGSLAAGPLCMPCALGRGGLVVGKREGDGATPIGRWPLREVYYRPDRVCRPQTRLTVRPIRPDGGWCDAPADPNYNRPVRHPYAASAEHLWRQDRLYDLVLVVGYNDRPRRRGRGSAIFLHVAQDDLAPTAGCVALQAAHVRRLLRLLGPNDSIAIGY
jgi:L,D-peptidoglycan transpeptidase YkuD (ErfK/YbiS/YcfS/YnhG family)